MVYDDTKKAYSVIKDYSADSECDYIPSQKGTYLIRVNAKIEGTDGAQRFYESKIVFG